MAARGQISAKALVSHIDLGHEQGQNTFKARHSSLQMPSSNRRLLDDYKMALTVTQGARKSQKVGPGAYNLPSIFEKGVNQKAAPRYSFSRCSKEKQRKAVLSIQHMQDYLGKESPGTAYYNANYEPILKHERVAKLQLTEDRFGSYWRKHLQQKSPGPVYGYTHSRDIASNKNKGPLFSQDTRFRPAKKSISPSPKYELKSMFDLSKKRGPVFGTSERDTRDPRMRATVSNFKTLPANMKRRMLKNDSPGPGDYDSPVPQKRNFKWSFSKGTRFSEGVRKLQKSVGDMSTIGMGGCVDMRKTGGGASFPKQTRTIDAGLWDSSYIGGSVQQV